MKNKLRKMLSLVLAVVIAMSAISVNTLAATIMNIVNGSNQKLYVDWYDYSYNFNGRLNTSTYGQIIKLNVGSPTGQVAYCIQSSKDAWTSDYTAQRYYNDLSRAQQLNIKHVLIYGYQGTAKYGYNADTERIATQIVNWNICDGWFNNSSESTAITVFTEDMPSTMAANVKACYNKIKEQMLSHTTIPSYAVGKNDTPTKKKMTTNSDGTFTITLTDSKNVSKYYDWQTAIKNYSYLSIITDTEGKLVIKSTKPIPSGSAITLTAKRDSNKYQSNIIDVAPMYMISGSGSQSSATFVQDYDPSEAKIAIYSDSLGTAQIKKVWEHKHDSSSTQASNSDIYFTIKNSSGTTIKATGSAGSYTYSASGSVTHFKLNSSNTFALKSLPIGTYTVYEYGNDGSAVPYYTRQNLSRKVTVTAGGTGAVTFTNTRNTGTGEIIKTWKDTNGKTIAASSNTARNKQIYFRIKNADGKYITASGTKYSGSYTFTGTSTTATSLYVDPDTGKFIVKNLPTGKYTVYEYGSPKGFTVNKASQTITISNGKTASVSFINSKDSGTAQIKKAWNHKNDTSGTKADNNDIYFTIKNSSGTTIKATGSAGSYTYSASGSVSQFKLNSSNTFLVKSLPAGTYTVYEYCTDGAGIPCYTRSNLSKTVKVTAGGTGTVTFTNTRNTGTGEVIKTWVDTNGNAISANAKNQQIYFRIKNADGKYITVSGSKYSGSYSFAGTTTTATSLYVNPSTGKFVVSDLPTGKYTVYEYGSPEGYSVNKASQTITISRDKTSSVSFVNSEDSGTAQIKKVWLSDTTLTSAQIANLEKSVFFMVKDSDGKFIKVTGSAGAYVYAGTQTTGNSLKLSGSKFNVSKLPMGTYTVTEINNASGYNPKTQTKTVTIANKGETKSVSFTNKSTPVVVIRKHFSDEDNLTAAQLKEQYAKVTVDLQVLGFSGSVSSNPPAGYYVEFTGSNGNYTYKGLSSTKTSATNLKLNDNGEMTISFGTNTTPYYLAVIETYSGTDYDVDNRDQRIDLGNGDPNTVIDLDDIELDNQLKTGSVQIDKKFLNENGAIENIPDNKLAEVAFKIKHNGKYLTFTGSNGSYTYKGENNTGTELKLNKATYNFIANELPAREEYTVYEVSGTTGYSFSIDPVTFTITPAGSVKKVFTNKAMTGTISIVKHSADGVLSGWKFRVYGTALTGQKYDKKFTTDALGNITISNLRIGNYTVEEVTKGVVGYITPDSKDVAVEYDKTATLDFTNIPIGNVHVTKVDKDYPDNKLTGAEFTVYETDGITEVSKLSEISTGEYQLDDLQYGDYLLKETKAPENYVLDEEYYEFSIRTADETVNVETNAGKGFENDAMTGTISISKHSADGKLGGWKFRVYGTALTGQKYDKTFSTDTNGKITVADLRIGNYTVEEVTTGIVGYITPESQDVVVEYNKTSSLEFTNIPIGNVHVTKVDKDYPNKKLTGAEFTVYKTDKSTVVGKLTEISTGEYQLNDLQYGDYLLKETKAPKNYILDNNFYAFSITEAGATINVETNVGKGFENDAMTGTINISKHSADGKLGGWKFRVYGTALTGQKYDKTFSTDTNGKITVADLRIGNYTVEEVTTGIVGYITPNSQNVTVEYNKTATLDFTNIPIGKIVLNKVDADNTSKYVPGSVYAVYKDVNGNGTYEKDIDTFVKNLTDNNGIYSLDEVPYGKYLVKEISAPTGYLVDDNYYPINIDSANAEKFVANTEDGKSFVEQPVRGNVEITKVDEDYPNNKLTGAEFTIYAEDKTTVIGKMAEAETGIYRYEGLRYGKYYLKETKAPDYFVQDVNFYYFEITENGKTVIVTNDELGKGTFINAPQKGEIKIVKTSYDNKVEGFSFEVTGKTFTGQSFSKIYTTDENGIIHITDLRAGEYNIHEVADDASAGYLLPDDKQLTIDRDGAMLVANMHNSKLPDNPPTGASEDSFTQTAVIIISMVMMSAAVVLVFPLSKRKRKR